LRPALRPGREATHDQHQEQGQQHHRGDAMQDAQQLGAEGMRRCSRLTVTLWPGLAAEAGGGQADRGAEANDAQHEERADPGGAPEDQHARVIGIHGRKPADVVKMLIRYCL